MAPTMSEAMSAARAQVAQLEVARQQKKVAALEKSVSDGKESLSAKKVELEKMQAVAVAKAEDFAQSKDPKQTDTTKPADPAVIQQKATDLENLNNQVASMKRSVEDTARQVTQAETEIQET